MVTEIFSYTVMYMKNNYLSCNFIRHGLAKLICIKRFKFKNKKMQSITFGLYTLWFWKSTQKF